METIGIVGVGAMGSALLERQRLAQIEPLAYDVDPEALAQARAAGAEPAGSAAELARSATMIDVVVRTDDEVLDCTLGANGILAGAQTGALILLHSTILPGTTRRVAEAASQQGVHVMDACMLSVPAAVRRGELIFLVGGPEEQFARAHPHLLTMAKEARYVGPLGTANVGKLMANLIVGAQTLVLHEALRLGEAGGIPYVRALEMLRDTRGSSGSILDRWESTFDPSGKDPTPRVGQNVMAKDIPLARELAHALGLDLPIIDQLGLAGRRLAESQRRP
ncbi:MAG TPA: NAD(P)-dependent oxidoreductase [Chloroflexota bacterium]|nr:NAD(P)-dependent oxidoreductase [Chloroflexota bacterium]